MRPIRRSSGYSQRVEIEAIVVSHGAEKLLRNSLRSVMDHPASGGTLVTVVDSGSPDSTPDMIEREFPDIRLIREANIGFSAANNVVLRESRAKAVLLLNPDTEIYEGTLDAALQRLWSEERIGMVGVKLVTASGELDHACKRSFPTPLAALAHFTGLGRKADASNNLSQYRATDLGDDEAGEVDAVNGAFMLCHFWDAGWKVFYEPAGLALHIKGGSSGTRRAFRQEVAFHRGMARFYRRFDAPGHNRLVNVAVYLGIGAKLLTSLTFTVVRGR